MRGRRARVSLAAFLALALVAPLVGVGPFDALANEHPTDPVDGAVDQLPEDLDSFGFWRSIDHDMRTKVLDADLHDVHFPSDEVGYAVGANATVVRTPADPLDEVVLETWGVWTLTDNEGNPLAADCPRDPQGACQEGEEITPGDFHGVHFVSDQVGFIVGDRDVHGRGVILKTTDGGNSWVFQDSGARRALHDVHFPTDEVGYAVGAGGTLVKTVDGGESWALVEWQNTDDALPTGAQPHWALHFLDEITGVAASFRSDRAVTSSPPERTTTGGDQWKPVTVPGGHPSVAQVNRRFFSACD